MRKTCVEKIYFRDDGSIPEVEMTSQGAGPPLNALEKIEAECACLLFGNVRIQAYDTYKEELGKIHDKDNVAYKYVDFKKGIKAKSLSPSKYHMSRNLNIAIAFVAFGILDFILYMLKI